MKNKPLKTLFNNSRKKITFMEVIISSVPKNLIDQDPERFVNWFTEIIKSEFSNEIDLFMEIRRNEHYKCSLEKLLIKKPLLNAKDIAFYINS